MTKKIMEDKSLLKNFCLNGTILGLKYFYLYPDRISRCFWTATLLLLVVFASSLSWMLYSRFVEMPTRITIENQYEPISSLPFPAVAICTPAQMTISSMIHFNKTLIDGNVPVDLESALPQLLGFYEIIPDIDLEQMKRLQDLVYQNRYTVPEVMAMMPQSCEDFLKQCVFKLKVYRCRDLFRPLLTKHGLCCAFNSAYYFRETIRNEKDPKFTPHMASDGSLIDALHLVVDYNPANALDRTVMHAGAVRVMLSDWTEFPSDDESVLVYPNVESFVAIRGTYTYCSEEVSSLASWSRECLFANERHLPFFQQYHNSDCDHLCYVHAVERRCGCLPLFLPYISFERACDFNSLPCVKQAKASAAKDVDGNECNCPRDCEARHYTVDASIGNLRALSHIVVNPYPNVTFTDSTSILTIFFQRSVYVKKKQETVMSLINLASNLGGVFGLCLGCSVISVLEILFFVNKAIRSYLTRRLRQAVHSHVLNYDKQ